METAQKIHAEENVQIFCQYKYCDICPWLCRWKVRVPEALTSAYVAVNGAEPAFTTFTKTINEPDGFVGTLDYLFLSPQWRAIAVEPLPAALTDVEAAPSMHEPSDHWLVAASLALERE